MNKPCQYISPNDTATGACACTALHENSAYCEEHHYKIYQKGSGRATRHKDIKVAAAVWDFQSVFNEAVAELEAEGFL